MTSKLLSNLSFKGRTPHMVSVAIIGATFFMGSAMAASGSTPIQGLDGAKPAAQTPAPLQSITASSTAHCPLNSGGPSLLGTTWRLESIYGNRVPQALKIDMRVSTTSLTGMGGCNKYSANFKQIGYTGFSVKTINKTKNKCKVIIPYKAAKSINVGSWEGSFLRTLKRMGSVRQMTDSKLYFFNRNGQIGMKFHKTADENKEAAAAAEKAAKIEVAKKMAVVAAAKRKAEMARKIATQKQAKQAASQKSAQKTKLDEKQSEEPIVRKIKVTDDDLITSFFKAVGL